MAPMSVNHSVHGDLPDPERERHHGPIKILTQPATGLDKHFLDDIANIDSLADSLVQT
jgi:hypothetical protein